MYDSIPRVFQFSDDEEETKRVVRSAKDKRYSYQYLLQKIFNFIFTILISQGSWVRYPVWQHTFVSPSAFSRRAVVSYWQKYVQEVLW